MKGTEWRQKRSRLGTLHPKHKKDGGKKIKKRLKDKKKIKRRKRTKKRLKNEKEQKKIKK